ncbi:MAG: FixH family protein [Thermodesulfobacteriota bacterium]
MTDTKKKNIYPPMIMLLIGSFLVFSLWSAMQAAGLGSKVSDAAYYSKGLRYNTTQVERRAAEVLGWHLETQLNGRDLEFRLTDREGGAVERLVGTLYLAIPGLAENIHLPLQEVASGNYRVKLGDNIKGTIQARLELERQGARLNRQLLLNL